MSHLNENSSKFTDRFLYHLSDHQSPKNLVYLGIGMVILFLVTFSLAPQISKNLGNLSVKKSGQYASADIGNFLSMINNLRASQNPPLPPLVEDYNLMKAACWKANDMATKNYYGHTDSLGRDPGTMLHQQFNIGNEWLAENLDASSSTADVAFSKWQNSPEHLINMIGPKYTRIGIGNSYNANSNFKMYWATEFASNNDPQNPQVLANGRQDCNASYPPPPPPPQATLNFAPKPCLATTGTTCTSKVSWNVTGYPSANICYRDTTTSTTSTQTLLGNGLTGTKTLTLPTGKKYTFVLFAPATTTCASNTPILSSNILWQTRGDADCSGVIDSVDALAIQRYVAKLSFITKCSGGTINQTAADVDGNGQIQTSDSMFVLQYASTAP